MPERYYYISDKKAYPIIAVQEDFFFFFFFSRPRNISACHKEAIVGIPACSSYRVYTITTHKMHFLELKKEEKKFLLIDKQ